MSGGAYRGRQVSCAAFRAMWMDPSLSVDDIAAALGIGSWSVRKRAKWRGLPSVRPRRRNVRLALPEGDEREFRRLWLAGVRPVEIARRWGVSPGLPRRWAVRLGLPPRRMGPPGKGVDPALLRAMFEAGLSHGDMARQVGMSLAGIRRWCERHGLSRGQGWRPRISLARWREQIVAARMAALVAEEQRPAREAEAAARSERARASRAAQAARRAA